MQLSTVQSKSIVRRVILVACRCLSMANILFWKLTEKYCFTIERVRIATRYKAQLVYSRKSCETILIIEHLKEVYHSICPALFRDGAFSCRHELPRALTGLAENSDHYSTAGTARPGGTCGKFRSLFYGWYRAPWRDLRKIQVIILRLVPRALTGLAENSGHYSTAGTARPHGTCGKFRSLFRPYYRAPSRDLRDVQVIISTFAHTGPRAEKAVCRRDAGKPTPRRRVGRLVCAAKTRAQKAERPPTYCRPSGQGQRGKSPCPPLRVALPGEPLAAGGTGGTNPRPRLSAGGAARVCRGLCF